MSAPTTLGRPGLRTQTAKNLTSAKAEWLEARRGYLGATDISAIHGINPYVSPHAVWLDKKGLSEDKSSIAMRAGTYMEAFIAAEFQKEFSGKIGRSKTYRHEKFPFLACNPDREITWKGIPALLECKNVGAWASQNFGQDGSDQIPEHYLMQILWQLIITRREVCVLAALIDNRELRTFFYSMNPDHSTWAHVFPKEMATKVFSYAIHWWRTHIEGDVEPALTEKDCDGAFLRKERDTYDNGGLINTDEATDKLCIELQGARNEEARAKARVGAIANQIKAYMAENKVTSLESTVGFFTWKVNAAGVATFKTPFKTEKA